jgi:hypothetical protein
MSAMESGSPVTLRSVAGYLLGVILGTVSLTLVFLGMRAVMEVGGACADGGPYVSAQPCPDGAPLAMTGGVIGLFAAAGLIVWFGGRLGPGYVALVFLGWPALFMSLGVNFLQYGLDPPFDEPGPEWGFLIPGVMFEAMGIVPLLIGLAGWRAARSGRSEARLARLAARMQPASRVEPTRLEFAPNSFGAARPVGAASPAIHPPQASAATTPAAELHAEDDVDEALVSQLERLAALHASGGLTAEEFATAKERILSNERLEE